MNSTAKILTALAAAIVLATSAQAQAAETEAASNLGTAVVGASQGGFWGGPNSNGRGVGIVLIMGLGYVLMADESQDTVQPERPPPGSPQPVPPPHHGTTSHH